MDEETAEALTRTKALYDAGVLTEEEWLAKKEELLHAPAVVVAQPPANEHGGVVQGHVVAVQPQKIHPEPRSQEDILAIYGSNEEASRAATLIQAEARRSAALKDYPLPPGATSATSLQGCWLGLGIGLTGIGGPGGAVPVPLGGPWCFQLEAHGHNRLRMTNQCGIPIYPDTCCSHGKFYSRERGSKKNMFKKKENKDCCNTLDFHNSSCLTFYGCQWICFCCLPVMCRIPFSGPSRTALPEVAPAPSITVQPGLAAPRGEQEQVKYAAEPEAYSSPHN